MGQSHHDTVVQITDTFEFAKRIRNALTKERTGRLMLGPVSYDKTFGTRQNYFSAQGVFQKGIEHMSQREFRFAVTTKEERDYIDIEIGSCKDIAEIIISRNQSNKSY